MARQQTFLTAEWTERWKTSYAQLSADRQIACDKAAIALIKQTASSGLRIKPIHPDKYYSEARLNSGDQIVFRIEEGRIFFIDIASMTIFPSMGRGPASGAKSAASAQRKTLHLRW